MKLRLFQIICLYLYASIAFATETLKKYGWQDEEEVIKVKDYLEDFVTPYENLKSLSNKIYEKITWSANLPDNTGERGDFEVLSLELFPLIFSNLQAHDYFILRGVSKSFYGLSAPFWKDTVLNIHTPNVFEKIDCAYKGNKDVTTFIKEIISYIPKVRGIRLWQFRPENTKNPLKKYFREPHPLFNKIYTRNCLYLLTKETTYTAQCLEEIGKDKWHEILFDQLACLDHKFDIVCLENGFFLSFNKNWEKILDPTKLKVLSLTGQCLGLQSMNFLVSLKHINILKIDLAASVFKINPPKLQNFPHLLSLELNHYDKLDDGYIEKMKTHLSNIINISLKGNDNITKSIFNIMTSLDHLDRMDLRECNNIITYPPQFEQKVIMNHL